ncbi:5-(carboxyamino)imidazole ribonucleotide synthase [Carnobacterium iners]|uniref:5-(carboxyamino)imidazole ribonucleotide synthase n=1 Tax=Carnobacterium iners TaxID=1073423 RepID=UPI000A1C9FF0|nr:5-(carboxyamino)imidazole ribonucleotide synthase [Carnobacterium iners]
MPNIINPGKTIGIIGGDHLGRMMALAAKQMGYRVGILHPEKNCPAAQVADWQIVATCDEQEALMDFAMKCDVVTYEFENIDASKMEGLSKTVAVPQGGVLLAIAQDRILEKAYLEMNKINLAPYEMILTLEDIKIAASSIGFPSVLKTVYDENGEKGQRILYGEEDILKCESFLKRGTCILEAWIPFERELSIVISRNAAGDMSVFPTAEIVHRDNLLEEAIVPARVSKEVTQEVKRISQTIAEGLDLVGTLGIELFLTSSGALYVSELVSHPHGSANYSIDACSTSQFETHIRAICGWPLPEITLLSDAVSVTIFGEQMKSVEWQIQLKPNWHFHYYGKNEARVSRIMGHITILTKDVDKTLENIHDTGIWI